MKPRFDGKRKQGGVEVIMVGFKYVSSENHPGQTHNLQSDDDKGSY
jgi:hypothetical protein